MSAVLVLLQSSSLPTYCKSVDSLVRGTCHSLAWSWTDKQKGSPSHPRGQEGGIQALFMCPQHEWPGSLQLLERVGFESEAPGHEGLWEGDGMRTHSSGPRQGKQQLFCCKSVGDIWQSKIHPAFLPRSLLPSKRGGNKRQEETRKLAYIVKWTHLKTRLWRVLPFFFPDAH